MTSPLRRKRPTTVRARNTTPARTAFSLAGLSLLLLGGLAPAQTPTAPILLAPIPGTGPSLKPARPIKPHDKFAAERAPIQQAAAYAPQPAGDVSAGEYQYLVEPPGPDMLFNHLDSEAQLQMRLEDEWRDNGHKDRLVFPDEPVLATDKYMGRAWPEYAMTVEPTFVCHKRLLFEQLNSERYGWDLGIIDPPLQAGKFFADLALLPYHAFTDPFRPGESSAGYCLPGDPVPLLIYPPERSASGTLAEVAAVLTVVAVFP